MESFDPCNGFLAGTERMIELGERRDVEDRKAFAHDQDNMRKRQSLQFATQFV